MATESELTCPKCGTLCKAPKSVYNFGYVVICLLLFALGFFTDLPLLFLIIGGVGISIYYYIKYRKSNQLIECPKCGFSWKK